MTGRKVSSGSKKGSGSRGAVRTSAGPKAVRKTRKPPPARPGTARKTPKRTPAADSLLKSRARMRSVAEHVSLAVFMKDTRGRYVLFNPAAARLTGTRVADVLGRDDTAVFPPGEARRIMETDREIMSSGVTRDFEESVTADGVARTVLTTKGAVRDTRGKIVGLFGIGRDVTEQKRMEEALRTSEEKCRSVVAAMREGVVLQAAGGEIIACNASAERILGVTADQLMGRTSVDARWQSVHEDGSPFAGEEHPAMVTLRTGRPLQDVVMGVHKPDGGLTWISVNSEPIFGLDEPGPRAVVTTFADITERKRLQEELQAQRDFAFQVVNSMVQGLAVYDREGRFEFVNPALVRMSGFSAEEMIGRRSLDVTGPLDRDKVAEAGAARMAGKPATYEARLTRKDGGVVHALVTSVPRRVGGEVTGSIAVVTDMTERRRMEEELRENEERFRALFEQAPIGIYRTSPEGRIVAANPLLVSMLKYESFEELAARNLEDSGFQPGYDRAAFKHAVERDGEVRGFEGVWIARDGTPVFVRENARAVRGPDGAVLFYEGTVEDITRSMAAEAEHRRLTAAEETLRQNAAQLEALREVSLGITAELDLKGVLRTVADRALTLLGADAGELFLHRPDLDDLELTVVVGTGASRVKSVLRRGEGLAGNVWERGEPVLVDQLATKHFATEAGAGFAWGSALGAPILWGGRFLGVLGVLAAKPGTFSSADAKLIELFASQAAVAIVNSRLYAEVEQLVVVDELTRLFNRRGLVALGTREVERARRFGHPLAALFIDLDRFKQLNDRHTHRVGDEVLRAVSERITGCIREIDIAARFGGEEFVVLLVETDLAGAREVAERLRQSVEGLSVPTPDGSARVTVSIGVAATPAGAVPLDQLVHRADEAMYAAKVAGRNRVVVLEG